MVYVLPTWAGVVMFFVIIGVLTLSIFKGMTSSPSLSPSTEKMGQEKWAFTPNVKGVKGKFIVSDAFLTKSCHFGLTLRNLITGEEQTVYGNTPKEAEDWAKFWFNSWQIHEDMKNTRAKIDKIIGENAEKED